MRCVLGCVRLLFFFKDTATTEIYTLSLHDALPIQPAILDAHQPDVAGPAAGHVDDARLDRKSTRLNFSHANTSYAVFCLKKNRHAGDRPFDAVSGLHIDCAGGRRLWRRGHHWRTEATLFFLMRRRPPRSTRFPYTTLFRTLPPAESEGAAHQLPVASHGDVLPDLVVRSEEHTSELQSRQYLVCRLLLEK